MRVDPSTFPALISADSSLSALRLSLVTAGCSTLLCLLLGVPLALVLSRSRIPGPVLSLLRALLLIPLVLPPVVGGLALLFTVGRQGLLGGLLQGLGLQIAFSTAAVVLAQTFVALPFLVLTLEGALRSAGGGAERAAAALGARPTRGIIDEYTRADGFDVARVGFTLDDDERRRRHVIQSLLQASGLRRADYRLRFGTDPADDFATELAALAGQGRLEADPEVIRLTPEGLAHSDAIGPALFSARVRTLMDGYEAR